MKVEVTLKLDLKGINAGETDDQLRQVIFEDLVQFLRRSHIDWAQRLTPHANEIGVQPDLIRHEAWAKIIEKTIADVNWSVKRSGDAETS